MNESSKSTRCFLWRKGFTLVELLVVIAIIGVLIGMTLPAVQAMRELARRSTCQQNLIQIGFGLAAYHGRHLHYPAGTLNPTGPIRSIAEGYHHNWISGLLPHIDAQVVADNIDSQQSVYAPANDPVRFLTLPPLLCPSAANVQAYSTCYAGIHHSAEAAIDEDNDGVFILNRLTSNNDITDGLSYTLFVAEKISSPQFELGWISGTRSSLRNAGHAINSLSGNLPLRQRPKITRTDGRGFSMDEADFVDFDEANDVQAASAEVADPKPATSDESGDPNFPLFVGGIQSHHPGGAYTLTGGGEVNFRSDSTDLKVLKQLAGKSDGELPVELRGDAPLINREPSEQTPNDSATPAAPQS
jgi:prepilin-type N-terminal cleavage/methylation domain-containing protein